MGYAERANQASREAGTFTPRVALNLPSHTERSVLDGKHHISDGKQIRRRIAKVRGKAAVKAAKKARHAAR